MTIVTMVHQYAHYAYTLRFSHGEFSIHCVMFCILKNTLYIYINHVYSVLNRFHLNQIHVCNISNIYIYTPTYYMQTYIPTTGRYIIYTFMNIVRVSVYAYIYIYIYMYISHFTYNDYNNIFYIGFAERIFNE